MSTSVKAVIETNLTISTSDTSDDQSYIDNSKIISTQTWYTGTGLNAINTTYVSTWNVIGTSGSVINLDLYELSQTIFNKLVTTNYSGGKIMALSLENVTTGHSYPLTYSNTGGTDFASPYRSTFEYDIYPNNTFFIQKDNGWNVDDNNRYIRLVSNKPSSDKSSVQIGLIGKV